MITDRLRALVAEMHAELITPGAAPHDAGWFSAMRHYARRLEQILAEDAGGWRSMDSAPKSAVKGRHITGAYILGFCPDEDAADPKGCMAVVWWEPLTDGGVWFGDGGFEVRPTHWRPLPEPPPRAALAAAQEGDEVAVRRQPPREAPASDMTDEQIAGELALLDARWGAFRADMKECGGHSGSPGESMVERMDELRTEMERRRVTPSRAEGVRG